jgi:hypothetical protein
MPLFWSEKKIAQFIHKLYSISVYSNFSISFILRIFFFTNPHNLQRSNFRFPENGQDLGLRLPIKEDHPPLNTQFKLSKNFNTQFWEEGRVESLAPLPP